MPELKKIETSAAYTPSSGEVVEYLAEEDGKLVLKVKKSDGTEETLSGGGADVTLGQIDADGNLEYASVYCLGNHPSLHTSGSYTVCVDVYFEEFDIESGGTYIISGSINGTTYDKRGICLYKNAGSGTVSEANYPFVVYEYVSGPRGIKGAIRNIRTYNRALTDEGRDRRIIHWR